VRAAHARHRGAGADAVRPALGILSVAAVLALGGCGGSEDATEGAAAGGGGVAPVGGQAMLDAQVEFARCMRAHGVDFPDPKPGRGFELDPGAVGESRLKEAESRCSRESRAIRDAAPERSPEQLEQDRDATLAFARCMRREGQDVPDPEAGGGGTSVEVPADAKTDPAFQRAQERCDRRLRDAAP
jgi:hypothetical protein